MPKYRVYGYATASMYTEVEAESEEAAKAAAESHGTPGLCHQCSSAGKNYEDGWTLSDGVDGEPTVVAVEVIRVD